MLSRDPPTPPLQIKEHEVTLKSVGLYGQKFIESVENRHLIKTTHNREQYTFSKQLLKKRYLNAHKQ